MRVAEAEPSQDIPGAQVRSASVAVIEVDPANPRSLERLVQLHRVNGDTPIIAAVPDVSVSLVRTLVREGVADVISLPVVPEELLDAALDALAHRSAAAVDSVRLAPMIAVARSIGGCGATSIATHLAAELGRRGAPQGVPAVVDLDLQFGSVADVLGASGRGTIVDLLDTGKMLDEELINAVARHSEDGLAVISAPDDIVPLESIDTDRLLKVLDGLRHKYSPVVLDLPANWTSWTLSAAAAADVVVLVVEMTIRSLRQAKKRLELFRSVGIPASNIVVVVNRFEKRLFRTISLDDVAETLHHPVLASIPLDDPTVSSAQDQGRLVSAVHRKSRFGAGIASLADALLAGRLGGQS
ncbi:AAA family ATPase [Novosphingobium album (ex Hu et al. 2023)]|uniref:P-loop NTPase n=1 Tax=Novosphingobium album (ex Hu et al. 2023) TaxID=2930093 RepID=A0ABT0B1C0_9SPHN|nr:P-loop NTPase [Novosphingobium album (ex Hu et al. 2023)]MCJ2178710.1 P-loop NTPase [Novosphingobium album (ex Hu et al. 2023)]